MQRNWQVIETRAEDGLTIQRDGMLYAVVPAGFDADHAASALTTNPNLARKMFSEWELPESKWEWEFLFA